MFDLLGPGTVLGYCTNMHPGGTLAELKHSLERHATLVRDLACPDGELPVGLWLSAATLRDLSPAGFHGRFRDFLAAHRLVPFTFNGFPMNDFQRGVVKHSVYRPHWGEKERVSYTFALTELAAGLIDRRAGQASVSTLPIGWGADFLDEASKSMAALAVRAWALAQHTGTAHEYFTGVHLDVEPEPGCVLDSCESVLKWFDTAWHDREDAVFSDRLRVCHDVCHTAVMHEDQAGVLRRYVDSGVPVGKVQISAALRVRFDTLSPAERREARRQLIPFAEDRFLHQTMVRDAGGGLTLHEDLPVALAAAGDEPRGEWRIHYHVPIFLERIGLLETTSDEIPAAIRAARELHDARHFEVETYAWPVLPPGVWGGTIEEGIAKELLWVKDKAPRWLAGEGGT